MKLFFFSVLLFLLSNSAYAQDQAAIKKALHQKAVEGNYGILYCQVGETVLTTSSQGFTGLIEIVITSNRIDTLINHSLLQNTEAQKALLQLSKQLVTKGVELRKADKIHLSMLSYRIPLYVTCKQGDWNGARIISGNIWMAREQLKNSEGAPTATEAEALRLGNMDAKHILTSYGSSWEKQYILSGPDGNNIFLLYRRMADLSETPTLGSKIIINKLNQVDQGKYDVYLNAVLEELAQVTTSDFILTNTMDPEGKDHNRYFPEVWEQYKKYRRYLLQQPAAYINILRYAISQFELTRLDVVNAGGSFGHQLSYQVSEYLQLLGRDMALLYARNGDVLKALEEAESTRGRALGDWVARSHPNTRFVRRVADYGSFKGKQLLEMRPANLGEIGQVAKENKANLLIYLNTQDGYLVWLITPGQNAYTYLIEGADSLVNRLLNSLPFNIIPGSQDAKVNLSPRGAKQSVSSANKEEQQQLLSTLYGKLLPDSIGTLIGDSTNGPLIIIPDGILQYVPFQALKNKKGNYLIQEKEISYWPSVTGWLVLKDAEAVFDAGKKETEAGTNIQIMGNPVFSGKYFSLVNGKEQEIHLEPLPGTLKETEAIAALFNTKLIQQQEAITGILLNKPQRLDVVHLATHGYTNTEDGMRSFIAFTNGPLYADYLYENAGLLKSRLIVLSACQTGLGMLLKDSPISLTNAFLIGGANSVISTLWSIDDAASAELMIGFYRELKTGKSIPSSLRTAQLQMLKSPKWAAPFYWGAFKVTGIDSNPLMHK